MGRPEGRPSADGLWGVRKDARLPTGWGVRKDARLPTGYGLIGPVGPKEEKR